MWRTLVLLTTLAGCSGDHSIPVHLSSPGATPEKVQMVRDAGELLGWGIAFQDEKYGAATIDVHQVGNGEHILGVALLRRRCLRVAWANKDPWVIAHELGHLMGLDHVSDPDNIMFRIKRPGNDCDSIPGEYLEDWQVDKIRERNAILLSCQ
jgi:hypothetical protein